MTLWLSVFETSHHILKQPIPGWFFFSIYICMCVCVCDSFVSHDCPKIERKKRIQDGNGLLNVCWHGSNSFVQIKNRYFTQMLLRIMAKRGVFSLKKTFTFPSNGNSTLLFLSFFTHLKHLFLEKEIWTILSIMCCFFSINSNSCLSLRREPPWATKKEN